MATPITNFVKVSFLVAALFGHSSFGYSEEKLASTCSQSGAHYPNRAIEENPDKYGKDINDLWKRVKKADWSAQNSLGLRFYYGNGVSSDFEMAYCLMLRAAGNPNSSGPLRGAPETTLGWWFLVGDLSPAVPIDDDMALKWNSKGAEEEHPGAVFNLALMYASGLGVERNYDQTSALLAEAESLFGESNYSVLLFQDEDDWKNIPRIRLSSKYIELIQSFFERISVKSRSFSSGGLDAIASIYQRRGRYSEALDYFSLSTKIREKELPLFHISLANGYFQIGISHFELGQFEDAIEYFERSITAFEKNSLHGNKAFGKVLFNLARAYNKQLKFSDSLLIYTRALPILKRSYGENSLWTTSTLNNMGTTQHILGQYLEASESFIQSLSIKEKIYGGHDSKLVQTLKNLAESYRKLNRHEDELVVRKKVLAILDKTPNWNEKDVINVLAGLARVCFETQKFGDAQTYWKRLLDIKRKVYGSGSYEVAATLNDIGGAYFKLGLYRHAVRSFENALEITAQTQGVDSELTARQMNNVAGAYMTLGRFAEATELHQRALAIYKKVLGPKNPAVATSLNNTAFLFQRVGRYAEALELNYSSLAIREKVFGAEHSEVAVSLNNIASIYHDQGRYAEALKLYQRSHEIKERLSGQYHSDVALSLFNIASIYSDQGRYAEALKLYQRALGIYSEVLGPDHPIVAMGLNNVALVYSAQGRFAEALELYQRSLAINERTLGFDHPDLAMNLSNIALIYSEQGHHTKALEWLQRTLEIREKAFGPEHPEVSSSLNSIAGVYSAQGLHAEALEFLQRSLAIYYKLFGPEHPDVALGLNNIAGVYSSQGRFSKALELYQRSLVTYEKVYGHEHPNVAVIYSNIALLYASQGRHSDALEHQRRGTSILRRRFVGPNAMENKGLLSEQRLARFNFHAHIDRALRPEPNGTPADQEHEAFEIIQLAHASSAGSALAQMALRFSSSSDAVSDLVRRRQDEFHQYEALDGELIKAVTDATTDRRNDILIANLRRQLEGTKNGIVALDERIREKFPEYTALTSREPLLVGEVQKLLSKDEALLTFIRGWEKGKTHVFVVRLERMEVYTVSVGLEEVRKSVESLRTGLDLRNISNMKNLPAFDTTLAFELYQRLFGPAEEFLSGVKHLFVVPTGPLQSLPLGVLVTKRPDQILPANRGGGDKIRTRGLVTVQSPEVEESASDKSSVADRSGSYRNVPWLAKRYAMTTLPSVASLKFLRVFAKRSKANRPFIGFGDPILGGDPGGRRGVEIAKLFRGASANVDEVRKLSRLPETAGELRSMALYLRADASSVHLGNEATETLVKNANLKNARVVAFSTHGLVSGEIKNLAEPALVLTPPEEATEQDDGLLTASEIALLKLDAEWVILSACNTALGKEPGAEGLSGLAKAFFYAGTRALLVSHWPVESESAAALTQGLFETLKENPEMGRSEALRRSMMKVAANDNHPQWAHPAFWAPFVVVGEGARR
jgi:tetratricopeptide (TPR) repeat protein